MKTLILLMLISPPSITQTDMVDVMFNELGEYSRYLAHKKRYEQVKEKMRARLDKLKYGEKQIEGSK